MKIILGSRRRHYAARVSVFLVTVALIAGMTGCGTPSQNLEIRDWYDLNAIRDNLGGSYLLMNDLDSTTAGYEELASATANEGKGWQPIGIPLYGFTGTFDGQRYEIRGLFIHRPNENYVGLFGLVDEGGVIENVGVVNVAVTGEEVVGGLVGHNSGTVSNCYSSGSVTGDELVGGLAGGNVDTVSNSYSTSSVTGGDYVGGLVGINALAAELLSYSNSTMIGEGDVGGPMGSNHGTVSNSYSSGSVIGGSRVGGLVGSSSGTVSNSFWDTVTSGMEESDGGAGKTTSEMQDIATFTDTSTEGLDEPWDITAVDAGETNPAYTWNIVHEQTYPFLSWES
ncbi:hypothetical protein ES706_06810 [subsurface metagenome]